MLLYQTGERQYKNLAYFHTFTFSEELDRVTMVRGDGDCVVVNGKEFVQPIYEWVQRANSRTMSPYKTRQALAQIQNAVNDLRNQV